MQDAWVCLSSFFAKMAKLLYIVKPFLPGRWASKYLCPGAGEWVHLGFTSACGSCDRCISDFELQPLGSEKRGEHLKVMMFLYLLTLQTVLSQVRLPSYFLKLKGSFKLRENHVFGTLDVAWVDQLTGAARLRPITCEGKKVIQNLLREWSRRKQSGWGRMEGEFQKEHVEHLNVDLIFFKKNK